MGSLRPTRGHIAQRHQLGSNRCDSKVFTLKPGESTWVPTKDPSTSCPQDLVQTEQFILSPPEAGLGVWGPWLQPEAWIVTLEDHRSQELGKAHGKGFQKNITSKSLEE